MFALAALHGRLSWRPAPRRARRHADIDPHRAVGGIFGARVRARQRNARRRAGLFPDVNAAGGVNGRKIELRSLDDGYEPDRAAANTKKLIDDGVFLLFGYVGTPTSNASKPIFTAAKVPFVGPFTGAESLRNPLNRYIFNVRASYFDETEKIVGQMTGQTLDRIAVFYQNDDYGKAGLAGVERAMAEAQSEDRRHRHRRAQHGRRRRGGQGDRQGRAAGRHHDLARTSPAPRSSRRCAPPATIRSS